MLHAIGDDIVIHGKLIVRWRRCSEAASARSSSGRAGPREDDVRRAALSGGYLGGVTALGISLLLMIATEGSTPGIGRRG